jgi:hypothetical protein
VKVFEAEWLAYARHTITSGERSCLCPAQDRLIRWPGYLGERYDTGRVLLVGAIHNTARLFTEQISALEPIARNWAQSPEAAKRDAAYLHALRQAYRASIPQWQSWVVDGRTVRGTVWSRFQDIIDALGANWDQVAFTNLAKCHTPVQSIDGPRIVSCASSFPIASLVSILQPSAVFVAKDARAVNASTPIPPQVGCLVRRYNNMTGVSGGRKMRDWLPEDVALYRMALESAR